MFKDFESGIISGVISEEFSILFQFRMKQFPLSKYLFSSVFSIMDARSSKNWYIQLFTTYKWTILTRHVFFLLRGWGVGCHWWTSPLRLSVRIDRNPRYPLSLLWKELGYKYGRAISLWMEIGPIETLWNLKEMHSFHEESPYPLIKVESSIFEEKQ